MRINPHMIPIIVGSKWAPMEVSSTWRVFGSEKNKRLAVTNAYFLSHTHFFLDLVLTDTPILFVRIRFCDVSRLAFAQIEIAITFGVLISSLALDIQQAKLVVFRF